MAITIHGSLAEWTQMRERERQKGWKEEDGVVEVKKVPGKRGNERQEDGSVMTYSYYNEVILQRL